MRLPPLPAEEWDDDVRRALSVMLPEERLNPEGAGTALSTLARHPALTKAFLRFSNHLLQPVEIRFATVDQTHFLSWKKRSARKRNGHHERYI